MGPALVARLLKISFISLRATHSVQHFQTKSVAPSVANRLQINSICLRTLIKIVLLALVCSETSTQFDKIYFSVKTPFSLMTLDFALAKNDQRLSSNLSYRLFGPRSAIFLEGDRLFS